MDLFRGIFEEIRLLRRVLQNHLIWLAASFSRRRTPLALTSNLQAELRAPLLKALADEEDIEVIDGWESCATRLLWEPGEIPFHPIMVHTLLPNGQLENTGTLRRGKGLWGPARRMDLIDDAKLVRPEYTRYTFRRDSGATALVKVNLIRQPGDLKDSFEICEEPDIPDDYRGALQDFRTVLQNVLPRPVFLNGRIRFCKEKAKQQDSLAIVATQTGIKRLLGRTLARQYFRVQEITDEGILSNHGTQDKPYKCFMSGCSTCQKYVLYLRAASKGEQAHSMIQTVEEFFTDKRPRSTQNQDVIITDSANFRKLKICKMLGTGGCGTVVSVEVMEPKFGKYQGKYALKLLHNQPMYENRHKNEAERAMELNHDHIVKTYGWFRMRHQEIRVGSLCYAKNDFGILMEEAETTLEQWVLQTSESEGRRLTDAWLRKSKPVMLQMGSSLQHVHLKGLVHRDIKPSNFLLNFKSGEPHVLLSDFGTIKPSEETKTRFVGTLCYMAPELQRQDPGADYKKCDMYSLGQTWKALLGRKHLKISEGFRVLDPRNVPNSEAWPKNLQDLVCFLRHKDATKRLDIDGVLQHEFFRNEAAAMLLNVKIET
ncbi:ark1 [Symbiodinium sp. CCMP2592]|nr:ark1 [Symbiodinium sp. CCMP2592]